MSKGGTREGPARFAAVMTSGGSAVWKSRSDTKGREDQPCDHSEDRMGGSTGSMLLYTAATFRGVSPTSLVVSIQ